MNRNKEKCYELFAKGYTPKEIVKNEAFKALGCRKTIYDWFKQYRYAKAYAPTNFKATRTETLDNNSLDNDKELARREIESSWLLDSVIRCGEMSNRILAIKNKLLEDLEEELSRENKNYRIINLLTQAIGFHWKMERESGFYHLLDVNVAMRIIESQGYNVIDPSEK